MSMIMIVISLVGTKPKRNTTLCVIKAFSIFLEKNLKKGPLLGIHIILFVYFGDYAPNRHPVLGC